MKGFSWWQKGVIYEIYPRSFYDANGDGIGDLQGIIQKLDYIESLGVDAIWICPFYPSPMADLGYDISDYKNVDPIFGSLNDFDLIVTEAHRRNLKVIIDFVPNHTSNQHPWFQESKTSRENSRSEWYLWKDADANGNPPNNWKNVFGGSAWEWNEEREQYYYHAFLKEQPDLNLRNPEVQKAIFDCMRFWLDRGVDGFRVDVMWHLYKDSRFRNNPPNPNYEEGKPDYDKLLSLYSTDHPDVIEIVGKMRRVMDEYPDKVMMGEMYLSIHQTVAYYGPNNSGAHLPGNFTLLLLDWDARKIAVAIDECESSIPIGAWPNWVLGNHDRPRLATRIGDDQVRVAAILILTLRGTPTMYYGDEIGMKNVHIPKEEAQDPQGKLMNVNRDCYRAPMQWSGDENTGFSKHKPWIRVADNYKIKNVVVQEKDESSLLSLYKKLLQVRREFEALQSGDYIPLPSEGNILTYIREWQGQKILVALNFKNQSETVMCEDLTEGSLILADTGLNKVGKRIGTKSKFTLEPNEGLVVLIK